MLRATKSVLCRGNHLAAGMAAVVLVLGLMAWRTPLARADDVDPKAINRAHDFLKTAARGRDVLSYVHFGASYQGHSYLETRRVTRNGQTVPGHFALLYHYDWENGGKTDIAFLCDAKGAVYEVQIVKHNAILQQPFTLANAAVKALGSLLVQAFQGQMSDAQQKELQKIVDDADAKAMLEWSLKFQQLIGR
jgi:hypothetical protein